MADLSTQHEIGGQRITPPRGFERTIALGHETRQVRFRSAVWFVVVFALVAAVIHLFLWWFLGVSYQSVTQYDLPAPPVAQRPTTLPAPLQPSPGHSTPPRQDLAHMHREEQQRLNSAGPLAGKPGFVHIPIEQAMDLLLERKGLQQPPAGASSQPFLRGEGP